MDTPQEFAKRKGFTAAPPGTTSYYIMFMMMRMCAKYYHEQQVKKFDLAYVVNRRELLLDFADYSERDKTSETTDECVDNYLDSIK